MCLKVVDDPYGTVVLSVTVSPTNNLERCLGVLYSSVHTQHAWWWTSMLFVLLHRGYSQDSLHKHRLVLRDQIRLNSQRPIASLVRMDRHYQQCNQDGNVCTSATWRRDPPPWEMYGSWWAMGRWLWLFGWIVKLQREVGANIVSLLTFVDAWKAYASNWIALYLHWISIQVRLFHFPPLFSKTIAIKRSAQLVATELSLLASMKSYAQQLLAAQNLLVTVNSISQLLTQI